ncbi:hypothetical protein SKAU_G00402260 [Synaphobranchus kaupii]|uniref:Uncharacterized protein n=1 Tax=Synaphobranchus kaupii TaxID=118154 RepID=A0A9Q1E9A6_SYNKA|nr:hypothetical protein SKAU_G00402260 [Synaphobranchus kaupii]
MKGVPLFELQGCLPYFQDTPCPTPTRCYSSYSQCIKEHTMTLIIEGLGCSIGPCSMSATVLTVSTGCLFIICMAVIIVYAVHQYSGTNKEKKQ